MSLDIGGYDLNATAEGFHWIRWFAFGSMECEDKKTRSTGRDADETQQTRLRPLAI